jgi:esterase FrsA
MAVGDRYMNEAKSLEKTDPAKANAGYIRAWRLYSFGRWPIPASPGKQRSYEKAIEAFLAHAKFWDPPLEIVKIPFEGKEIVGYMRLPRGAVKPVPLVIAVNGLDSRKEDLSRSMAPAPDNLRSKSQRTPSACYRACSTMSRPARR